MSRAQCSVRSGPAPIPGSPPDLPPNEWPAYHDCYESAGHHGKHSCGCRYEWSYPGEIPALDGLSRPAPYDKD
jgi:hypothetical protein